MDDYYDEEHEPNPSDYYSDSEYESALLRCRADEKVRKGSAEQHARMGDE